MRKAKFLRTGAIALFILGLAASGTAVSQEDVIEVKAKGVKAQQEVVVIRAAPDAHTIYLRLQHAAKRVCGVEPLKSSAPIQYVVASRHCYRDALSAAVKELDIDELTKIHEG